MDETYLKVKGKSVYLYRAIDKNGNLVDSLLSNKRDMNAARRFFWSAMSVAGRAPEKITTDGHPSYPQAIQDVFGKRTEHRDNWYLNRHIERDHPGVKQRYYPMLGFSAFPSAQRFLASVRGSEAILSTKVKAKPICFSFQMQEAIYQSSAEAGANVSSGLRKNDLLVQARPVAPLTADPQF